MSASWCRGPRKAPKAAQAVDHSPWKPETHPSPTVAEMLALGNLAILRRAGEAHYTLLDGAGVVAQGSLEDMKAKGEAQRAPQDVQVADQGSIVLFRPLTDAGRGWLDEHVQEDAQWFGGALVCEHLFAPYLIEGMVEGGLSLSP